MSDSQTSASGVPYSITTQYIKDFSFENPRAPQVFAEMQGKAPQVQVSVAVGGGRVGESIYECVLDLKAVAKHDDDVLFVAELSYAGIVLAHSPIPDQHLKPLLMVEIPRQLFPFARAILANATREGGFMPLLLAPVNFEALHQQQNDQIDAEVRRLRVGAAEPQA